MDVVARVIWGIELDDPVYLWDVETSRCNIGTDQCARRRVAELEEAVCAGLLFEFAVEFEDGEVDVVEQLGVEFDAVAAAEEDDDFLLLVLLEEAEEQPEARV